MRYHRRPDQEYGRAGGAKYGGGVGARDLRETVKLHHRVRKSRFIVRPTFTAAPTREIKETTLWQHRERQALTGNKWRARAKKRAQRLRVVVRYLRNGFLTSGFVAYTPRETAKHRDVLLQYVARRGLGTSRKVCRFFMENMLTTTIKTCTRSRQYHGNRRGCVEVISPKFADLTPQRVDRRACLVHTFSGCGASR